MITSQVDKEFVVACAMAAHSVNNAYRIAMGQKARQNWPLLKQEDKDIVIEGVYKALTGATPEQMHESWKLSKIRGGWVFGPVIDNVKKEHPCLVDNYSDLPSYEQAKDELFIRVIRAMVDAVETGKRK